MNQKAVFITYNQALHGLVQRLLEKLNQKGYTQWDGITGCGSLTGEPHLGSHAWPTLNGALLVITDAQKVPALLQGLREIDQTAPKQGLRAFVWNVEDGV
ncbi:MAG: hypothetical protein SPI35_03485 [Porphyromonas sp.]|nr:hypothetical protein [Porphyromonas sp.]